MRKIATIAAVMALMTAQPGVAAGGAGSFAGGGGSIQAGDSSSASRMRGPNWGNRAEERKKELLALSLFSAYVLALILIFNKKHTPRGNIPTSP